MGFSFEQAALGITERLPEDRGAKWLVGRLGWVVGGVGGKDKLAKEFAAGDPDAARIHRLLFEQYAHLRDCPVIPGHEPYSDESRQAALDLAEEFALSTDLPVETIQANWAIVTNNVYPGEQEKVDRPPVRVFTE